MDPIGRIGEPALAVVAAFVMVALFPVQSVEGAEPYEMLLSDVDPLEVLKVDVRGIAEAARSGGGVALEILGSRIQFTLVADKVWDDDVIVVGPDAERDTVVESQLRGTGAYRSANLEGADSLTLIKTSNSIYLCYSSGGVDYFVDPVDVTGSSGYYAVYTPSEVH